jgi:hypothetical protein
MAQSSEAAGTADTDLAGLAAEAFIYGYPLVADLQAVDSFTREGMGSLAAAPLNEFSHADALAGPEDRFVSINNDTVYSIANVDTGGGPVRFDVPDAAGRYYVMQFVDAWTNNFAYVGRRGTGTAAASFLLVPPDWDGPASEGLRTIRFPTAVATIVGRWAVDGEADLPAVGELQQGLALTPTAPGAGLPAPEPGVPEELEFFEQLRTWMRVFPPAGRDLGHQARFEPLGLLAAESPYRDPDPALAAALGDGLATGREYLERNLRSDAVPRQGGWNLTYHAFDYNLDFFEVGALNDSRWKLPDRPERYLHRAAAARGGLWGNHGYEAAYAMVYIDSEGRALDGEHRYTLRFAAPPPCRAFWSVTMYDTPDYYLVDNPIHRYSIGDRTRGLHRADDGSLTIVMQREAPGDPEARANWLPTPAGSFRPILRMYEPEEAVFDGRYELPAITRVG